MVVFFMASGVLPLSVSVQVSIYDADPIFFIGSWLFHPLV